MKKIDLHVHTNYSRDGELSPSEIIELAKIKGVKIIAITDHNTISGIDEAINNGSNKGIIIIPGVEISCKEEGLLLNEVHILGLFINHKDNNLKEILCRTPSVEKSIKIIKDSQGISILAHPGIYLKKMDELVNKFIEYGGDGLEISYPYEEIYNFSKEKIEFLKKRLIKIVEKNNLLISGGSDFHGQARKVKIGDYGILEEEFERLKEKQKK